MYKSYVPYLQHILDECLYVRSVIKDDMQREEFLGDETPIIQKHHMRNSCSCYHISGSLHIRNLS